MTSETSAAADDPANRKQPLAVETSAPLRVAQMRTPVASRTYLFADFSGSSDFARFAQGFQRRHEYRSAWFALVALHTVQSFKDDVTDGGERVDNFLEMDVVRHIFLCFLSA
jgi:hypothetical protein